MFLDLRFEEVIFEEDQSGENGPEAMRRSVALLKKAAKTAYAPSEAYTDLVMGLENKAVDAVYKAIGRTRRPNSQDSYDDDGTLSAYIPVDTAEDVTKVRDLLDREGRSYDFAPYVVANGLALLPKGVNGPVFKTDGSGFQRGSDLDEWIEEHAPRAKAKRAPRKRTR
jgi:hypothetical protein